jgi:hypothetical protein
MLRYSLPGPQRARLSGATGHWQLATWTSPPMSRQKKSLAGWVGISPRQSLLGRSPLSMHVMRQAEERRTGAAPSELETIFLSGRHLDYLGQIAHEMNPDMPESFGLPHLIRTILDRVERSGIDLTDASSEEDIARLAAGRLGGTTAPTRRDATWINERLFSSAPAVPRSDRSSLPARDRLRSGRTPRSGRG